MPPCIQRIKKRECTVDIAAPATMEVVSIRRFRRRRPLRAKKIKPQSRFKTLASILQRLFISGLTRSRYVRRGSPERKPFQGLFHFRVSAQKVSEFKSESRIPPPESFCFPVVSHHSPVFSVRKFVLHAAVRVFSPSSGNGIKKLAMAKIFSLNKTLFTAW